jgi:RNA polymerase sigma-70 factor (ECF subfamily)
VVVSESFRDGPGLEAFDTLYREYFGYVWKVLGRLGVVPANLPDAVHDVFVIVYRRWDELDPARPVRPWLWTITWRVAAGVRRKQRDILVEAPERGSTSDAHHLAGQITGRVLLWRLLAELDEDRLEVVVLHDLEGHTGADIGRQLGISVHTVHSRLRLARADLAAALARRGGSR